MEDKPPPDLNTAPMESATAATATTLTPPPKPPRPLSPREQAKSTLKEAFPDVDDNIIEAVLIASGGNIEPAFNALLGMTDPSYKPEATDAVLRHGDGDEQPSAFTTSTSRNQLEQDELLARQLAQEDRPRRQGRRSSREQQRAPTEQQQPQGKERSFIDDDLPVIRDNIKKGWSSLMNKVKSKLDGEPEQPPPRDPRLGEYGRHQRAARYDADPRVLGDDFSHLNIQEQGRQNVSRQSYRPLANPDLFKSTRFSNNEANEIPPPKPPRPDQQNSSTIPLPPQPQSQIPGGPSPSKKWEPLRPAEDRDPFAVGDSDDEEGKDDLYGTAAVMPTQPATSTQETGIIPTAVDPPVSGKHVQGTTRND